MRMCLPEAKVARMSKKPAHAMLWWGGILAIAGAVTTFVYLLQPWRSCPEDDTPAGCVMFPLDAAIMLIAMLATLAGVVLVAVGAALGARRSVDK